MVSSSFRAVSGTVSILPSPQRERADCSNHVSTVGVPLVALLVASLVTGALLIAPEQPAELASICERHHSPAVCRVW